jgi:hypothetical protein
VIEREVENSRRQFRFAHRACLAQLFRMSSEAIPKASQSPSPLSQESVGTVPWPRIGSRRGCVGRRQGSFELGTFDSLDPMSQGSLHLRS